MKTQHLIIAGLLLSTATALWYASRAISKAHLRERDLELELRTTRDRLTALERSNAATGDTVPVRDRPAAASSPTDAGAASRARPGRKIEASPEAGEADDLAATVEAREAIRARMQRRFLLARDRDARRYSTSQIAEIDRRYEEGLTAIDTPEGRARLQELVSEYPDANRAGCAAMNLGAAYFNEGRYDDARRYFEQLINANSQAYFQSGESVLAKALFNYGMLMQETGNDEAATAAWQRIVDELGNETDSHGAAYSSLAAERLRH